MSFKFGGSDDVDVVDDELDICSGFDFFSQLATFLVDVSTTDSSDCSAEGVPFPRHFTHAFGDEVVGMVLYGKSSQR